MKGIKVFFFYRETRINPNTQESAIRRASVEIIIIIKKYNLLFDIVCEIELGNSTKNAK